MLVRQPRRCWAPPAAAPSSRRGARRSRTSCSQPPWRSASRRSYTYVRAELSELTAFVLPAQASPSCGPSACGRGPASGARAPAGGRRALLSWSSRPGSRHVLDSRRRRLHGLDGLHRARRAAGSVAVCGCKTTGGISSSSRPAVLAALRARGSRSPPGSRPSASRSGGRRRQSHVTDDEELTFGNVNNTASLLVAVLPLALACAAAAPCPRAVAWTLLASRASLGAAAAASQPPARSAAVGAARPLVVAAATAIHARPGRGRHRPRRGREPEARPLRRGDRRSTGGRGRAVIRRRVGPDATGDDGGGPRPGGRPPPVRRRPRPLRALRPREPPRALAARARPRLASSASRRLRLLSTTAAADLPLAGPAAGATVRRREARYRGCPRLAAAPGVVAGTNLSLGTVSWAILVWLQLGLCGRCGHEPRGL